MMTLKFMIVSLMLVFVAGCSSGTKIDFAEYLLPTKNLIVESKYGEVHSKATYVVEGKTILEARETLAPSSLKGVIVKKWDIEDDGIYLTVKDMFTGDKIKRKYADRELSISKGTVMNINGGEYSVLDMGQTIDSIIGKLSPCIIVKKDSKRGSSKRTYCKGYGEMQSEENSTGDEPAIVEIVSIK